jgi:hypothetical protein
VRATSAARALTSAWTRAERLRAMSASMVL